MYAENYMYVRTTCMQRTTFMSELYPMDPKMKCIPVVTLLNSGNIGILNN